MVVLSSVLHRGRDDDNEIDYFETTGIEEQKLRLFHV